MLSKCNFDLLMNKNNVQGGVKKKEKLKEDNTKQQIILTVFA